MSFIFTLLSSPAEIKQFSNSSGKSIFDTIPSCESIEYTGVLLRLPRSINFIEFCEPNATYSLFGVISRAFIALIINYYCFFIFN
jgi:hypothetical protein